MNCKTIAVASLMAGLVLLPGCEFQRAAEKFGQVGGDKVAERMRPGPPADAAPSSGMVDRDVPYTGGFDGVFRGRADASKTLDRPITVATGAQLLTLQQVAQLVEERVKIPVVVEPDVFEPPMYGSLVTSAEPAASRTGLPAPPAGVAVGAAGQAAAAVEQAVTLPAALSARSVADRSYAYSWNGTAAGFLDFVTARYGIEWDIADDLSRITLSRYVSKSFNLVAPSGARGFDTQLDSSAGNTQGASGGGGFLGGGGQQSQSRSRQLSTRKYESDPYADIEALLKAIVPDTHGRVVLSKAQAKVFVRTSRGLMRQVARQVAEINDQYSRQIALRVTVLRVNQTRDDEIGVDLSPVFRYIQNTLQFAYAGPISGIAPAVGASSAAFTVLGNARNATVKQFEGSSAIARAIQSQLDTTVMTEGQWRLQNGVPFPVRQVENITYLQQTSGTVTGISAGVASTTTVPGTIPVGLVMDILPRVLGDQRISFDFSLTVNGLNELRTVATGTTVTELPDTTQATFSSPLFLRNGEVLVIGGIEEMQVRVDRAGTFSPDFFGLGGRRNANRARRSYIVVVQAHSLGNRTMTPTPGMSMEFEMPEVAAR